MLGIKVSLDAFRVLPVAPHQDDLTSLESFDGTMEKIFDLPQRDRQTLEFAFPPWLPEPIMVNMTISTIVAEAPTLGQAIRNIVNPLMALASVFVFVAIIIYHLKEDFARRNQAIFILIILILFWIIAGTMIFSSGPPKILTCFN